MRFDRRVAIVTGGADGIGRQIVLRLASEGADTVIADIDIDRAQAVRKEVEALGRRALASQTDVGKSTEVKAMINNTLADFGAIDILVNNAGDPLRERKSLFCDSREEDWDFMLAVNLKGVLNCTHAVINHMIARKNGKVLSISSCAGTVGTHRSVVYSAAKAGVIGFTMALAKEVANHNINVNCISPGPIQVGRQSENRVKEIALMTGLGRNGKPEEVAALAAFLVSDEASFIHGQNYAICGLRNLGID